jgi:hypothetical protein
MAFLAVIRDVYGTFWHGDPRADFMLKPNEFAPLVIPGQRTTQALIGSMRDFLLGMEAHRSVKLYLEPLALGRDPPGVDPLILRIRPMILAVVHRVPTP